MWAVQWVWPIIAYGFILYSEIRTNLSYGHPLIPRRPDKRGLTVAPFLRAKTCDFRERSHDHGNFFSLPCFFEIVITKLTFS